MRLKLFSLAAAGGLVMSAGGTAFAQDAEVIEGPGMPLGESTVVHPTVGAQTGIVNNLFYQDTDTVTAGIIRVFGEAAIASQKTDEEPEDALPDEESAAEPAAPTLEYRAALKAAYTEYLSGDQFARAQRSLSFDLMGHLVAFPEGTVAFLGDDDLRRVTDPFNHETEDQANRIINKLDLGLRYQPGGRTIAATLKYDNLIDVFEDSNATFANRLQQTIGLLGEWQWLPITKFSLEGSYGFFGGLGDNSLNGMPYKASSNPIRIQAGVGTAITEITTVKAHAGWAYSGYDTGPGYNAPVLGAEFGYRYNPLGRFVLEYNWDYRDSINANFYRDHHFTAKVDHQVGLIVVDASLDFWLRNYQGISSQIGAPARDDVIFEGRLGGQYVYKDWMAFTAGYRLTSLATDYRSMDASGTDDPSYTRHELLVGVKAAF